MLFRYEIQSVIIEGGAKTLDGFIDSGLWDEAFVFEGDVLFFEGLKAPVLKKASSETLKISNDTLTVYKNN